MIWKAVHYGVDRRPAASTTTRCASRRAQERPKLIIAGGSAYARIIDFAAFRSIADEVGAIFLVDMAHFAGLVAGGVYPSPGAARARRHQHHAQDAARSARRADPLQAEHAKAIDKSVFPGTQGGPLEHVIAAKAVAFEEALTVDSRPTRAGGRERQALAAALIERGFAIVSGGTDTHLMLVDLRPKGLTGKVAEKALGQRRHHGQQEHHSRRAAVAVRHERHPDRHAGRHDARHGHGRDGADRGVDRPRAHPAGRGHARPRSAARSASSAGELSALSAEVGRRPVRRSA